MKVIDDSKHFTCESLGPAEQEGDGTHCPPAMYHHPRCDSSDTNSFCCFPGHLCTTGTTAVGDPMFQNHEPVLGKVLNKAKSGFNLHVGTFLANGVCFKTCKNNFVFTC